MATKSSTKKTKTKTSKKTTQKHDLLYIMSNSCGWCKKANPIVEELVKDGYKITTLDVMNPDEGKRANEVKQKFNAQCGTPLFLDAETGNSVCGFREKDVLEKWAKGEEIPKPPQPKSPPPPPPAEDQMENPEALEDFKNKYEAWAKENDHLPKIMPIDVVMDRIKKSYEMKKNMPQQPGQPGAPAPTGTTLADASVIVSNDAYYQVIGGVRELVMADSDYVNNLKHQYFVREADGELRKVVGDTSFKSQNKPNKPTTAPGAQVNIKPNAPGKAPAIPPAKKTIDPKVKAQLEKMKKDSSSKLKAKEAKSKSNTKTVAGL